MRYILIKGVQFENKGAELMLHAVRMVISEQRPDLQIVLSPGRASTYAQRLKIGCYQYLNLSKGKFDLNSFAYLIPKRFRVWLLDSFGIVLEPEVDGILDASGFAYGDKWPDSEILKACGQIERLKRNNRNYIFLAQAFGPFSRPKVRAAIKRSFSKAELIFARDKVSFRHVKDLIGKGKALTEAPDFTNLLKCAHAQSDAKDMRAIVIPNSNMISRRNAELGWSDRYVSMLIETIEELVARGVHVDILNHEGRSDESVCASIYERFRGNERVSLVEGMGGLDIKSKIASSDLVISSRYHGCVSALSSGVPCIGTSWSHKYEELFRDYGVANLLVKEPLVRHQIVSLIEQLLEEGKAVKEVIGRSGGALVRKSEAALKLVLERI